MTTTRFDASTAGCTVFTLKEGLLSAVAHDLRLRVETFSVDLDLSDEAIVVRATFDPRSLRVDGVMKDGELVPDALGPSDRAKIERSIAEEVLHAKTHASIRFGSTRFTRITAEREGFRVEGRLELHGVARTIAFDVKPAGDALVAEIPLHQPDFGIRPFTAMLGAIKIKAGVTVRLSIPRGLEGVGEPPFGVPHRD